MLWTYCLQFTAYGSERQQVVYVEYEQQVVCVQNEHTSLLIKYTERVHHYSTLEGKLKENVIPGFQAVGKMSVFFFSLTKLVLLPILLSDEYTAQSLSLLRSVEGSM